MASEQINFRLSFTTRRHLRELATGLNLHLSQVVEILLEHAMEDIPHRCYAMNVARSRTGRPAIMERSKVIDLRNLLRHDPMGKAIDRWLGHGGPPRTKDRQ